ncbi:MAG: hypothetical protein K9N10_15040 [Deltaproteobacteria bacterium]|nr:hypothetical protein [Deltaproteobacteria bacterium]
MKDGSNKIAMKTRLQAGMIRMIKSLKTGDNTVPVDEKEKVKASTHFLRKENPSGGKNSRDSPPDWRPQHLWLKALFGAIFWLFRQ